MNFATFVVVSIVGLLTIDCFADTLCHKNEIFELGKTGEVGCSLQEDYFGVYWYDTQDLTQQPIIYREDEQIGGYGYESNLFDITNDGSLIIINVTLEHERIFTVVILETSESPNLKHETIDVKVFVRPRIPYPVILECDGMKFCYKAFDTYDLLNCTVEGARPPVHLKWLSVTAEGDVDVTFQREYSDQEGLNTTTVTMRLQAETASLRLLACKADSSTMVLDTLASVIIAEIPQLPSSVGQVDNLTSTVGTSVTLACNGFDSILFFVWKIFSRDNQNDVIAYGYIAAGLMYSKEPYSVNSAGSLVFADFSHTLEGVYVCYASDGIHERASSYHVTSVAASLTSTVETHERPEKRKNSIAAVAVVPIVAVAVTVTVVTLIYIRVRRNRRSGKKDNDDEECTLNSRTKEEKENLSDNRNQLKVDNANTTTTLPNKCEQDNEVTEERDSNGGDHDDGDEYHDHDDGAVNAPLLGKISVKKDATANITTTYPDRCEQNRDVTERDYDDDHDDGSINAPIVGEISVEKGATDHQMNELTSKGIIPQKESTTLENDISKQISIHSLTYDTPTILLNGLEIRNYTAGSPSSDREKKVILVCGARGPIKTNFLNNLITFFLCTKEDPNINCELQGESSEDYASSGNIVVNKFNIYTNPSRYDFDLTIMDLHDSRNSKYTKSLSYIYISNQIYALCHCDDENKLSHVNAIIFSARHQKDPDCYSFTRIFGNNLINDMHIYDTIVDSGTEQEQLYTGYQSEIKSLTQLASDKRLSSTEGKGIRWDRRKCSFAQFSTHIKRCKISLDKTIEVLRERDNITQKLGDIQANFRKFQEKHKSLQREREIKENNKVDLGNGKKAMTCRSCQTTCHFPCEDIFVSKCHAMRYLSFWRGCDVCYNHCYPSDHEISDFRYKSKKEKEEDTKRINQTEKEKKDRKNIAFTAGKNIDKYLATLSKTAASPTVLSINVIGGEMVVTESLDKNGNHEFLSLMKPFYDTE